MTHNENEISSEELIELLQSIDHFVEKEVSMYALGGTALTLLGIKRSTLDFDVNIHERSQHKYMCKIFEEVGFEKIGPIRWRTQEGIVFDLFSESNILGTQLKDDCVEISRFIKSFGKIKLYTLSPYDIIISKLARGDMRDFDDIKKIFEKENIDVNKLVKRYRETMELSVVANYRQKLLDLVEIKFREWNIETDQKMIQEIRKWDER